MSGGTTYEAIVYLHFYVHARGDADEAQELIDYYHPVMVLNDSSLPGTMDS